MEKSNDGIGIVGPQRRLVVQAEKLPTTTGNEFNYPASDIGVSTGRARSSSPKTLRPGTAAAAEVSR